MAIPLPLSFSVALLLVTPLLFASVTAQEPHVLIVGAGLAGAKAAYELSKRNITFTIIEATDRVGGRLRNDFVGAEKDGFQIELGANWIQGFRPGDPFTQFATSQVNLTGIPTDFDDMYFVQDGKLVSDTIADPVWDRWERALNKLYRFSDSAQGPNGTDLFDATVHSGLLFAAGWEANTPIEKSAQKQTIEFEYAVPATSVSILELSPIYRPDAPDSVDYFVTDPRGFKAVVTKLLQMAGVEDSSFPGPQLLLNSPVRKIKYNKNRASVTLRNGKRLFGSAVISTVSLGVLQEGLFRNPKEPSSLLFEPKLPYFKRLAISKFELADYMKIFIQFTSAVFTKADPLFLNPLECAEGGLINIQNLNKDGYFPGLNAVMVTGTDAYSRDLECLSDEEALKNVLEFTSLAAGRDLARQEVKAFVIPRFRTNQFFKGSYSVRTPGITKRDKKALNKPLGALFFAGEAHDEVGLNGYVQGAWNSAENVAKDVIRFLGK